MDMENLPCITKFYNCQVLRNHQIVKDDLWIMDSKIIDPENYFFNHKIVPNNEVDCGGSIISPGFIDVQINGGFGVDFSYDIDNVEVGLQKVGQGILAHGVTSYCPTLVSSRPEVYHKVLPYMKQRNGGFHGAEVLGAHVEGPFINPEKKGAHDENVLKAPTKGLSSLEEMYKHMDSITILTIAPELENAMTVIKEMSNRGVVVSLGHSAASIAEGEEAVRNGASFITHLFNAMLPFHHRDPGLVGLLASDQIPENKTVFYGIIADGNHTHPSTTRIAYRAYKQGIVLVTDACSAMGLSEGVHYIGSQPIEVRGTRATLQGTNTLSGSIATMVSCVHYFWKTTDCSLVEALEAVTLHPASLMNIEKKKGTLDYGSDADLVLLDPKTLEVKSTWIGGQCVYRVKDN